MTSGFHHSVLTSAVTRFLITKSDGIYVDGTLGGGGHAEAILTNLSGQGKLIAFDIDNEALRFAKHRLERFHERVIFLNGNFSNIKNILEKLGIGEIDGLLLDLGISSFQIDEPRRGFSFQRDHRIDMRMNQDQVINGWDVINNFSIKKLQQIFQNYGEERYSKRIANKIVKMREKKTIDTTTELSEIVESIVGKRFLNKSLARIFQAIRIEVNRELDSLREVLNDSIDIVNPGGRIVVISYHSLEDRIVKDFFREQSTIVIPSGYKYIPDRICKPSLKVITKKPIISTDEEIHVNPRARSAKLRAAERI